MIQPGLSKKDLRRKAILRAAAEVSKDRRYDEVKLEEIAAQAGVGKGTLYLYFKDKEDLFVALIGEGTREVAARIREIADSPGDYRARFLQYVKEMSQFARRRFGLIRLMQQSSKNSIEKKAEPYFRESEAAVFYLLKKGVAEGALRDDIPLAELHCLLVGPLFFRNRVRELRGRRVDLDSLVENIWSVITHKKAGSYQPRKTRKGTKGLTAKEREKRSAGSV
ncbi:MAG: TetR/AcrR family transcriptional regulator [Kiritimatiellales bacterium]